MNATTTETTQIETKPTEDRFALAVKGLEPDSVLSLRSVFEPLFARADEWATKASQIKVVDVSQKAEMKLARESRLALKQVRVDAEKARKRLKEDSLRKGKAIDGIYNVIAAVIEPLEAHLLEQETFAERFEKQRKDTLRQARAEALRAYGADPSIYADLGETTEETWNTILENARTAHEAKLEAARKAEEERVAREKAEAEARETARIEAEKREAERVAQEKAQREENERLKREAAEREAAAKAERERLEAERRAVEEQARKEREAIEAKARAEREAAESKARAEREAAEAVARAEREARERAEAELAAAKAAEAARLAAEEKARQAAALAPDRDKLAAFATTVRGLALPAMATPKGKAAAEKIAAQVAKLAAFIEKAGAEL